MGQLRGTFLGDQIIFELVDKEVDYVSTEAFELGVSGEGLGHLLIVGGHILSLNHLRLAIIQRSTLS